MVQRGKKKQSRPVERMCCGFSCSVLVKYALLVSFRVRHLILSWLLLLSFKYFYSIPLFRMQFLLLIHLKSFGFSLVNFLLRCVLFSTFPFFFG